MSIQKFICKNNKNVNAGLQISLQIAILFEVFYH